ncbi:hypothetical protein RA272_27960, partial [Pseudomonas syringae pv. tagetis]
MGFWGVVCGVGVELFCVVGWGWGGSRADRVVCWLWRVCGCVGAWRGAGLRGALWCGWCVVVFGGCGVGGGVVGLVLERGWGSWGVVLCVGVAVRVGCSHWGFWVVALGFFVCGFQVVF